MLVDLDVGSNRLAALPAELGQVTTLRFLNAMNNRLEVRPIGQGAS